MAKRVSVDKWLFTVTLLLVFIGLVMVFSASAVMAKERFGSPYGFLVRQMAWAAAGIAGHDRHHERRLQEVPPAAGGVHVSRHHVAAADCRFPVSRFAQYASLDQVWRLVIPAVGGRQAGAHFVSRLLPGVALAANHRLEERADSGCRADASVRAADRERARPGHRDRLRGDLRRSAVRRRHEHEVSVVRAGGFAAAAVFPDRARAVAMGAHAGLSRSLQGPAGQRLPHHSIDDRGEHWRPDRAWA